MVFASRFIQAVEERPLLASKSWEEVMKRKRALILAVMLFLALPVAAQEKTSGAAEATTGPDAIAKNSGESASPSGSVRLGSRNVVALPDAPRPIPFPAAASAKDEAPGRQLPRYELGAGYSYVNFNPGSPFPSNNNNGVSGSFVYNASPYLGLVAEFSGYNIGSNVNGTGTNPNWNTWLFGPRLNLRRFDYFVPFVEFLAGGAHGDAQLTGTTSQNAFALAAGGGVDIVFSKHVAWRFAQIDYLMTNFSGANLAGSARQDNLRLGTGIVVRFGLPNPPPPAPKLPPTASCSASPASVYAGSNDLVAIHVSANSPDNFPLTYSYTASGGAVEGNGPEARWNSSGVNTGAYTISAKIDDGKGGTASCTAEIRVEERPHHPPTVSVSANPATIKAGERSAITCDGASPDNLPLTYSYSASGGKVVGSGPQAQFDSTGVEPGTYNVKCEVTDSRNDTAAGSTNIEVQQPPPPPEMIRLEQRLSLHSIYFPTAQPTVANPNGGLTPSQAETLNALAVDFKQYLAYKPDAHLILAGHADIRGSKEYNDKLSERRVERARSYLVEKGIPADHIEIRAYGFEKNMSSEEVKGLIEADPSLTPAEKQRLVRNLLTVRLANNRRVDVTLSTTGEQSVRRFPFSAKDALTLLSRTGGETANQTAPAAARKKKPTP
jgi:outer membrane protein OmpA-like peptidoglycan-associated protein